MLCALIAMSASFIVPSTPPQVCSSHMRARHIRAAAQGVADSLPLVSDDTFEAMVLSSTEPVVIDFAADYCGPCRLVEPTLTRLNANEGITVAKVKLDKGGSTTAVRDWLGSHGVQITALPTLVLVKNGRPARSLIGVKQIMQQDVLHDFAFDDIPPPSKAASKQRPPWKLFESLGARLGLAFS